MATKQKNEIDALAKKAEDAAAAKKAAKAAKKLAEEEIKLNEEKKAEADAAQLALAKKAEVHHQAAPVETADQVLANKKPQATNADVVIKEIKEEKEAKEEEEEKKEVAVAKDLAEKASSTAKSAVLDTAKADSVAATKEAVKVEKEIEKAVEDKKEAKKEAAVFEKKVDVEIKKTEAAEKEEAKAAAKAEAKVIKAAEETAGALIAEENKTKTASLHPGMTSDEHWTANMSTDLQTKSDNMY